MLGNVLGSFEHLAAPWAASRWLRQMGRKDRTCASVFWTTQYNRTSCLMPQWTTQYSRPTSTAMCILYWPCHNMQPDLHMCYVVLANNAKTFVSPCNCPCEFTSINISPMYSSTLDFPQCGYISPRVVLYRCAIIQYFNTPMPERQFQLKLSHVQYDVIEDTNRAPYVGTYARL